LTNEHSNNGRGGYYARVRRREVLSLYGPLPSVRMPEASVKLRHGCHCNVLIKLELPAAARGGALRSLNDYNINYFTLFQTEDALVKMLEVKAFDLAGVRTLV
jgi:hypothetical protein